VLIPSSSARLLTCYFACHFSPRERETYPQQTSLQTLTSGRPCSHSFASWTSTTLTAPGHATSPSTASPSTSRPWSASRAGTEVATPSSHRPPPTARARSGLEAGGQRPPPDPHAPVCNALSLALDHKSSNLYASGSDGRVPQLRRPEHRGGHDFTRKRQQHQRRGARGSGRGQRVQEPGVVLRGRARRGCGTWPAGWLVLANTFWASGVLVVKTRLPGELATTAVQGLERQHILGLERFRVHDGGVARGQAGELVEMDLMLRASEVDTKSTSVELVQINATSTGGACGGAPGDYGRGKWLPPWWRQGRQRQRLIDRRWRSGIETSRHACRDLNCLSKPVVEPDYPCKVFLIFAVKHILRCNSGCQERVSAAFHNLCTKTKTKVMSHLQRFLSNPSYMRCGCCSMHQLVLQLQHLPSPRLLRAR